MTLALNVLVFFACTLMLRGQSVIEGRVLLPHANAPAKARVAKTPGAEQTAVAVIYLAGAGATPTEKTARLVETNLSFLPTVLPIQVGTRVEFLNQDRVAHSLFSYSVAKRFELGLCAPDECGGTLVFNVPGLVTIRCDEHEQMRGFILVLDTPYFVLTDNNGNFRLDGLPTGEFVLKAWLNNKVTLERLVTLGENSRLSLDFLIPEHSK